MPRQTRVHGALAGWLFADLALMLSFVFIDSSTPGRDGGSVSSSTVVTASTSTTLDTNSAGVRAVPIKVGMEFTLKTGGNTAIANLERAIDRSSSRDKDAAKFLVVIINGGAKGFGRQDKRGTELAAKFSDILIKQWNRVDGIETYFVVGDDSGIDYGNISLQLFPVKSIP
jgi:hypothetical protein